MNNQQCHLGAILIDIMFKPKQLQMFFVAVAYFQNIKSGVQVLLDPAFMTCRINDYAQ